MPARDSGHVITATMNRVEAHESTRGRYDLHARAQLSNSYVPLSRTGASSTSHLMLLGMSGWFHMASGCGKICAAR